ncbi:uncharacterized protein [Panulirus ornatus]|uniref:uncharacterized protein n=1 Tax=Panulirus ornatus TaxID=150431 RepID=UPI003A85FEB9
MDRRKEGQDGLPEIYLSPSHHFKHGKKDMLISSDSEENEWDDTDNETWTPLIPETNVMEDLHHMHQEPSLEQHQGSCSLGLREEIEGDSSQNSFTKGKKIMVDRNQALYGITLNNEGTKDANSNVSYLQETDNSNNVVLEVVGNTECSGQRGETPGSDCPPVAGIGAFSRTLRQPLMLDTNFSVTSNSELIFSPGGDEGFMVPGGVHAYYGSESDTETLEWAVDREDGAQLLIPVRDAVEGADGSTVAVQAYLGNVIPSGVEEMERNSPAGLSTPDVDTDLTASAGKTLIHKKLKNNVRPPVMGQSEELLVQASRKDLGSTDGEESDDENQRRLPAKATSDLLSAPETQPGSLGSQSENTDSVNTVLDMSRGEIQGCEGGDILDTPVLSSALVAEPYGAQSCSKPAFVVGGLISPRGKFRQFQNTVRDRMQDMKASLELQPSLDSPVHVDRDQFLSQPSVYQPVTPVSEQEVSLMSMISVESTNHPESSERVTSPSVLSVSSAASSRRMEWDSGADVGYSGNVAGSTHEHLVTSLSTLERIAIGNYASVLRTEPEGTTQVKEKQRVSKKSNKFIGTKVGSSSFINRQTVMEGVSSSPSRLLRIHQTREKMNFSSSDEEFGGRLSSPAQSPRRRPRRRVLQTNTKEVDSPQKRVSKRKQVPLRRLKEVMQELCSDGKSSSLMELTMASVSASQYRRSSSQQSLSLRQETLDNVGNGKSIMSVMEGSPFSITKAVQQKNMSKDTVATSSTANVSTSASTLVQSVSPVPQTGVSGSTNSTLVRGNLHQHAIGKIDKHRSVIEITKHSSHSSLQPHDRESKGSADGRTWIPRSCVSSKSHDSSDMETPPDMKDTDGESCTSHLLSDDEPVNLKARKNSENAKNHESNTKKCTKFAEVSQEQKWKDNDINGCSSSLQLVKQRGSSLNAESVLESQISLLSSNNALQALSVRLKERIQALIDDGSLKKVQDYNKLQDYIHFIGIPSASEEEYQLRQGVANVIMRMFGEIGLDDTDTSNTFNSETSEVLTTDSQMSDQHLQNMNEHTAANSEDLDIAFHQDSKGTLEAADSCHLITAPDNEKAGICGQEYSMKSGSTVCVVPYRPLSATRTYFMAVSRECDEGLVEGEHPPTPKVSSPLLLTSDSELKISHGYAEGQRGDGEITLSPSTSPVHQLPDGDDYSSGDSNFEDPVIPDVESELPKNSASTKDQIKDDSESIFHATASLHDSSACFKKEKIHGVMPHVVSSEECSPLHAVQQSAWECQSSWHEELGQNSRDAVNWWSATTRSERLYKDRRGTLHVANQPPGYMDDRDSHPSESMSDHEHYHQQNNPAETQEDVRRALARPWTSSGSESAYETIRERHRHVDEALASSFEFYSTSPWDTRLLGYVSSDAGRFQDPEEFEEQSQKEGSPEPLPLPPSPPISEELAPSGTARLKRHVSQRQQQHQVTDRQNSSLSSQTDGMDVSSQVSFIQLQKQHYVRKIQRHIHTLEKLERALLVRLGDSIGSENSFRRCVTEGRSHTESDTNGKSQTRDILGQSETATSSIISSDYSDEMTQKQPYQFCQMGRLSKTKGIETQPDGQDSSFSTGRKSESMRSTTLQSHTSSPRVTLSHLSSDLTSSRTSTLKQVEEEVRKLAFTEEKSRYLMKNSRLHPPVVRRGVLQSQDKIRKMPREDPRGEEDPVQSRLPGRRSISDNTLDSNTSLKNKSFKDVLDWEGTSSNVGELPSETHTISEGEITNRAVSDSQISRQGDGREERDQTQISQVDPLIYKSDDDKNFALQSPPVIDRNVERQQEESRNILFKDFGQMFPSRENILVKKDKGISSMHLSGHSVGVQTSDSLLDIVRSPRESKGRISSRPSSSITSDRVSEDVSSDSSTNTTSSRLQPGENKNRKVNDCRQASGVVSDRGDDINASEQGKNQLSRLGSMRDEKRLCKIQGDIVPLNEPLDGENKRSSKTDFDRNKKASVKDMGNMSTTKQKTKRDRNGINSGHRSITSYRVGSAKDASRHMRDNEVVTLSRPSSRCTESRHEEEHRTVELSSPRYKKQESKHMKEGKALTSSMPGSARSERAHVVEFRAEPSFRSGDLSMPETAKTQDSHGGSESEASSGVESTRNDIFTDGCTRETSLNAVSSRKEFQCTDSTKNNSLIRKGAESDKWQVLNQTGQDVLRIHNEREKSSYFMDEQNSEPFLQGYNRERAKVSLDIDHNRPLFAIPSASQKEESEKRIQVVTKSVSGSLREFSRRKGLTSPPVGSSSALSEGSGTLRSSKNMSVYINSNQISSDVSNTTDDLKCDTKVLGPKNKTVLQTFSEEKTAVKQRIIRNKKPIRFDVSFGKENLYQRQPQITENCITSEAVMQVDKTKENLTLQEALAKARPDYIREASDRRALIRLKREMRQDAQDRNHQIVAQIPANLQTPSTLQRFLYKSDLAPLFSYRDIREQNRRLYRLLPEASIPGVKQIRLAQNHTNQLMARLYSQRLRKKVISGQVSHAHKEIVTPIVSRVQRRN